MTARERMRVLMPVYNRIEYDGRVQRAASALAERYEVRVLALGPEEEFAHPRFEVHRVPAAAGTPKPVTHLRFLQALLRDAARFRPDVVHAHDFFMALPGWMAARATGARLVYDAHELIIPEPGVPQGRRDRLWYRMERFMVGRADLVIAANPERARFMAGHYGLRREPMVVENIPPLPARGAAAAQAPMPGPDEPFRLVYQGDMSLSRGLGELVGALTRLPARFELLMVGSGPDLERLKEMARELGVGDRVRFVGRVPRADLDEQLRTCHAGLISYAQRGLNNLYCAPNKLYEYAQAGLPMFARENPVLRRVLAEHGIGVVDGDVARGVAALAAGLEGFRARLPGFVRDHAWEDEAAHLLQGYEELRGPVPGALPLPPRVHGARP